MQITMLVELTLEAPDALVESQGWEVVVEALDDEVGNMDVDVTDDDGKEHACSLRGIAVAVAAS